MLVCLLVLISIAFDSLLIVKESHLVYVLEGEKHGADREEDNQDVYPNILSVGKVGRGKDHFREVKTKSQVVSILKREGLLDMPAEKGEEGGV